MKRILILNGPNLNLIGTREPDIYGTTSLDAYLDELQRTMPDVELRRFQSNVEGHLIDCIQTEGFACDGMVINAGGYSHTSVALRDALASVPSPAVEVHISNIFAREAYRHHSLLTPVCRGMVCGLGLEGYRLAVEWLLRLPPVEA
ncbi:MAG: type II 3-dehydroquinate dehydratase [Bacteroidales bacterium]|nr:type II 3-dehydroquinate dehydratase [Bacteroidales bacterium]